MEILTALSLLLFSFMALAWSSARSYFAKGRFRDMEEATLEIIRGMRSHYEAAGQAAPESVAGAIEAVKSFARGTSSDKSIDEYQARLWVFGDSVGDACWRKGYEACRHKMTPADDRIRISLSLNELLQPTWLAHLGFKSMMPNYRGFETHRFSGEEDGPGGREGGRATRTVVAGEAPPLRRSPGAVDEPSGIDRGLVAVGAQVRLSQAPRPARPAQKSRAAGFKTDSKKRAGLHSPARKIVSTLFPRIPGFILD